MRKLFLTSFKFITGKNEYEQYRIVAVNSKNDEHLDMCSALDLTKFWFKATFPESELLSVQAHPTITESLVYPSFTMQSEKGIDGGKRFYPINDHEGLEEVIVAGESDGYTKDVLIDLDGNKKNFRVGWYDTDDEKWYLHGDDDKIDMKYAVYTKLDF